MAQNILSASFAGCLALFAFPLSAQDNYRVEAHSTGNVPLQICSSNALIRADGDDDTDLDFWLYGPDGGLIFSDTDTTDLFIYRVRSHSGGCKSYRLEVKNYGSVYNMMALSIEGNTPTATAVSKGGDQTTTDYFRVEANDTDVIAITACKPTVDIRVDGDNDTDLDFFLYDPSGNLVFSDTDTTDLMIYTLRTSAGGGNCLNYRLEIRNLGSVYNIYTMTISR